MADDSNKPIGWVFEPRDDELITILNHKLQNKPISSVIDLDLYSDHPSTLLQNIEPVIKQTKQHVIYTPRYHKKGTRTKVNRRVSDGKVGIWNQVSKVECRCKEFTENAVGKVTRFVFLEGNIHGGSLRMTDWSMEEFTTMKGDGDQFAICKVSNQPLSDFDDFDSDLDDFGDIDGHIDIFDEDRDDDDDDDDDEDEDDEDASD